MLPCPWCDDTFSDVESLEGHRSERHGWLSEEDYECLEATVQIDHEDHEDHDTPPPCTERKRKSSDSFSESSLTEDEYEWIDMVEKIDYLNHGSPPCKKKKTDSYDEFLQEIVESPGNVNLPRDTDGGASKIWRPWDDDSPPPQTNATPQVGMGSPNRSDESSRGEIVPDSHPPGPSRDSRRRRRLEIILQRSKTRPRESPTPRTTKDVD